MVYVMSDIHGNLQRFESIMNQINLQPEDTLFILGDVIDRYPDGIKIIRKIMKMPNVQMLLGNHEYMMLNAIATPYDPNSRAETYFHEDQLYLWYYNEGDVTHNYIKHIRKELRKEVFEYLRNLPVNVEITVNGQKYRLVHGSPVELYKDYHYKYANELECAVWHRWAGSDPECKGCIGIFGHTPTDHYQFESPMKIWYSNSKRRIGIDCGCGYPVPNPKYKCRSRIGRLACLRLDDMKEFYSE